MNLKKLFASSVIAGALVLGGGSAAASAATVSPAAVPNPVAACGSLYYVSPTETSGAPSLKMWCKVQAGPAWNNGYTGPVDGVPGVNTWKAIQRWVQDYGYTGPVDGVPGPNTYRGMERFAQVTVNGSMSAADWKKFALQVRMWYFAD